mmetsp:Transcript_22190/g.71538  ORF Transcript_22190/g.71538 Transcript_22190/m.71538 type:complete len:354 (-) Transcript_22190:202-1263(-)
MLQLVVAATVLRRAMSLDVRQLLTSPEDESLVWTTRSRRSFADETKERCDVHPYATAYGRVPVCLRSSRDYMADRIKRWKRWIDCPRLVELYGEGRGANRSAGLFVDVGATYGSCTVELLLAYPKALVIAVEPSDLNLFYLTETLKMNERTLDVADRVAVLTVAAGNHTQGRVPIVGDARNHGNSQVGAGPLAERQTERAATLRRLDDLVRLTPTTWAKATNGENLALAPTVVKMDVQGYECWALEGMTDLLTHVRVVRPEIEVAFLERHGCGPRPYGGATNLIGRLHALGFPDLETADGATADPRDLRHTLFLATRDCRRGSCDFTAKRPPAIEKESFTSLIRRQWVGAAGM